MSLPCSERQYKTQFGKWEWSKNARKSDMTKALKHYKSRAAAGKASTRVTIKGKQVDGKKMRRAIKEEARAITSTLSLTRNQVTTVDEHVLPFTNSL
jgi:hypothetical protein